MALNNMFDLTGKVALVTGASRGIGEAIAVGMAEAGADLVIASRRQDGLMPVAAQIEALGRKVVVVPTNAGESDQLEALVAKAVEAFGGVDILVNNAGISPAFGPLVEADDRLVEKIFKVNVFGYVKLAQLCYPLMKARGGGKIINIASVAGLKPGKGIVAYSMSKAAVISLTQGLANELGPDNIQVNAIAPGIVRTKMGSYLIENEHIGGPALAAMPVGRFGEPQDLVGLALYLSTAASNWVTGTVSVIDGGQSIGGVI